VSWEAVKEGLQIRFLRFPSKRGPDVIRYVLNDYKEKANSGESFLDYSGRQGERYYYDLLKPLASVETLQAEDYIDWGQETKFSTAIGVGECAGVMIDLVATLILESDEKIIFGEESIANSAWADSIYHAYAAMVNAAKALLLQKSVQCNTQTGILKDFDLHFTEKGLYTEADSFKNLVLQINQNEPSESFALSYLQQAKDFIAFARQFREQSVLEVKVAS
jgi:sulfite reductase (ferredoxin)